MFSFSNPTAPPKTENDPVLSKTTLLKKLYEDHSTYDCTLLCSDGKPISAHKNILSEYTLEFQNEFYTKKNTELEIPLSSSSVKLLLMIMYQVASPEDFTAKETIELNQYIQDKTLLRTTGFFNLKIILLNQVINLVKRSDDLDPFLASYNHGLEANFKVAMKFPNTYLSSFDHATFDMVIKTYEKYDVTKFVFQWAEYQQLSVEEQKQILSCYFKHHKDEFFSDFYKTLLEKHNAIPIMYEQIKKRC